MSNTKIDIEHLEKLLGNKELTEYTNDELNSELERLHKLKDKEKHDAVLKCINEDIEDINNLLYNRTQCIDTDFYNKLNLGYYAT